MKEEGQGWCVVRCKVVGGVELVIGKKHNNGNKIVIIKYRLSGVKNNNKNE